MSDPELRPRDVVESVVKPTKGRITVVVLLILFCFVLISTGLTRFWAERENSAPKKGPAILDSTADTLKRLEVVRERGISDRAAGRPDPFAPEVRRIADEADMEASPFADVASGTPESDPRMARFEAARNGSFSWSTSGSKLGGGGENLRTQSGAPPLPTFPSFPAELLELARQGRNGADAGVAGGGVPVPSVGESGSQRSWRTSWRANGSRESGRVLREGKVIEVQLLGAVQSDLSAGAVRVQVRQDVLLDDGSTGIPRGSVLVGEAGDVTAASGGRIALAFRSLTFPDGRRFEMPETVLSGADGSGGAEGDVNRHTLRAVGSALLLGLVSAGFELSQPERRADAFPSSREITAGEVGRELSRVSAGIISKTLDTRPTIKIPPGRVLTMITDRPVVLE